MLKLAGLRLVATMLSMLMLSSPSIGVSSTLAISRNVLGSISTSGSVRVGEVGVPAQGTIFEGDLVNTGTGIATIQYRDGARVTLASDSQAIFATNRVQLKKGQMTFQTVRNGVVFAASSLQLKPAAGKFAANVTLNDSKVSIAVTEGSVKVLNPSGIELASLTAGDARLFEDAPNSVPDRAERAEIEDTSARAATARAIALKTQLTAALASATALGTRLDNLGAKVAGQTGIAAQISAEKENLSVAVGELASITQELGAVPDQASQRISRSSSGPVRMSAHLPVLNQRLESLNTTINTFNASANGLNRRLVACANTIGTPAASVVPFCQH